VASSRQDLPHLLVEPSFTDGEEQLRVGPKTKTRDHFWRFQLLRFVRRAMTSPSLLRLEVDFVPLFSDYTEKAVAVSLVFQGKKLLVPSASVIGQRAASCSPPKQT
jgi:hypothetical protein